MQCEILDPRDPSELMWLLNPPIVVNSNKPRCVEYSYTSMQRVLLKLRLWRYDKQSVSVIARSHARDRRQILRILDVALYYGLVNGG